MLAPKLPRPAAERNIHQKSTKIQNVQKLPQIYHQAVEYKKAVIYLRTQMAVGQNPKKARLERLACEGNHPKPKVPKILTSQITIKQQNIPKYKKAVIHTPNDYIDYILYIHLCITKNQKKKNNNKDLDSLQLRRALSSLIDKASDRVLCPENGAPESGQHNSKLHEVL